MALCSLRSRPIVLLFLLLNYSPSTSFLVPWIGLGRSRYRPATRDRDAIQVHCRQDSSVTDTLQDSKRASFSLEYSFNFHRHVIRNNTNYIVRSFWWKDDALAMFPNATMLPLGGKTDGTVAGELVDEQTAYTRECASDHNEEWRMQNVKNIYSVFETVLKWFPSQVDQLFELFPNVRDFPAELLEERFRFLLAPLPDDSILRKVNTTEDIDWPKIFEADGAGAGMSVAQLSHALQTIPEPFLLRNSLVSFPQALNVQQKQLLYRLIQDPTIADMIVPMAKSVLDLWVAGMSYTDILSFSYLHHMGWEWSTFRIVLHALPACHQYHVGNPKMTARPGTAIVEPIPTADTCSSRLAFNYLTARLQLRPWLIEAMLRTHRNLVYYRKDMLRRNLDYFQQTLQFRSAQLREIILLKPSLLGMSPRTMHDRVSGFWCQTVGLSLEEVRKVARKSVAILEYSTDRNLVPTHAFFRDTLRLEPHEIIRLTIVNPNVWGRSTRTYYEPLLERFLTKYRISAVDYGRMISRAPELVAYNLKAQQGRLDFLCSEEGGFTAAEVRDMVIQTPRILKENIETSLIPKLSLIRSQNSTSINPNWLLYPIQKINMTTSDQPLPKTYGRSVVTTWASNGTVSEIYSSAKLAATATNTSISRIYTAISKGIVVKNRIFTYLNDTDAPCTTKTVNPPSLEPSRRITANDFISKLSGNHEQDGSAKGISRLSRETLLILTDGRAFPPEDAVRGRPRSGGLSLQIHGWDRWREYGGKLWKGRRTLLLADQTLLLDYPYLQPSHRRCSLYVCREALRLASLWISGVDGDNSSLAEKRPTATLNEMSKNRPGAATAALETVESTNIAAATSREVIIGTESHYVANLLSDVERIASWGKYAKKEDFLKHCGRTIMNADIVYPLARTLHNIIIEPSNCNNDDQHTIKVRFLHYDSKPLREGAKLAARMTYYGKR